MLRACFSRPFPSLRVRLLVLILAAALPAFVLVVQTALEQRAASIAEVQVHAREIADMAASEENDLTASFRQLLMTLARLPAFRSGGDDEFRRLGSELMRDNPRLHNIARVDLEGNTVASVIPLTLPVNVSDRPYFRNALRTGGIAVGDYQIGRITGKSTLNFAYPVRDDKGAVTGVLYTALDLDWLNRNQVVKGTHIPPGGTLTRIDRNGVVFAHLPDTPGWRGAKFPVTKVLEALQGAHGAPVEATGPDGVVRFYVSSRINRPAGSDSGYVILGIPRQLLFREGDRLLRIRLSALGIAMLLGILAAWYGTDAVLLRPFHALLAAARRFGEGDLSARSKVPPTGGEMSELAAAFDRMAEAVAEREAALRASEQRFRTYVENSSDIVFVLSPTGVFGYISPNSQGALGYAMDEVVGRPFEPFVHPDDLDVCRDFLSKVFAATGKPAAIEYRVRHKDGAWRWYSANAALIRDPGTETPALLGIARDITGRKQQEDALRQSELRLRAAVDNIPHDFWSCDADGRYLMLNATAVRKWNRAETLIGKRPEELDIPEEMRAIWTDNNRRALSGETVQRELRYEIDGTLYRQLDLLAPILDGDAVCGLVGLSIDISELARVEDSLRETNEQLEALLESAPIAIVVVSSSGVVTQWNRAAEQISGWRREEVLGNPLPLNPDADNEATLAIRARLLAGGELHGEQLRTIRKDGQAVDLNIYTTPLHGAAEHSGRLLMLCEDITERLQADARRSELEELLRQAQKMEAVGQLAGGIAHDFNNLMTVVLGQIDMIRKRWNDPALAQRLDEIDKAGQRAATLTRQLLAFSRRQMLQPRVVDLNAVVADIRLILDRSIGENYALDIRPGAGLWPVLADPTQIGQVVVNLVVNARDALPEGGEIRISTRNASAGPDDPSRPPALPAGDYVLLAVRDDGTGMDAATKARLFEPFFTTKDVGRGTGLGLSTAYGIVMQSGGHIRVESELGAGTTVEIWLPRSEGEAELPKQVEIPPAPPRGDATLLLVEDAGHVRDLVRDILEECGYTVLEAGNGHEALSVAAAYDGPIDLLLTDMVMPGMNGRKLAEAVQAARPGIRVLFMSGYSEESAFRAAEGRAGLAFLQKPFTPEDLGWKLHELLAQPRG